MSNVIDLEAFKAEKDAQARGIATEEEAKRLLLYFLGAIDISEEDPPTKIILALFLCAKRFALKDVVTLCQKKMASCDPAASGVLKDASELTAHDIHHLAVHRTAYEIAKEVLQTMHALNDEVADMTREVNDIIRREQP